MNYLKTMSDLFSLRKHTRLTRAQMQALQDRKLRALLHFAWEHSAFYRRTFEKAGIIEQQLDKLPLSAFPTIDKTALLEHFDELITVPGLHQEALRKFDAETQADRKPYLGTYHVVHSSGSTGKPGYFVYDEAAWHTMLLFDDLNVIEVEDGAMYLTCLYNFAQPLIRYRISDHLVLKEPLAGSPFTRAEILLGRNEDLLWFEDGSGQRDFLHPLAVEGFCIEGLLDYQFRQSAPDAFEMLAEAASEEKQSAIEAEMLRQMRDILKEKHLSYVKFTVRFVEEIRPNPKTGKKALIVPYEKTGGEEPL